jgi:hypothetical protein
VKRIGIATVTTGFNFGSSLQSFASKVILNDLGYEADLLKLKGSLITGRDIRLKKLFVMIIRSLIYKKNLKALTGHFLKTDKKKISQKTKKYFLEFNKNHLSPKEFSWSELKKKSKNDDYYSFICGSDQVWNGDTLYVDPFYYLEFAPDDKKIAFAPSFGREKLADYNIKTISEKLIKFKALSVREEAGCKIIKNITGKDSLALVDPTLVVSKEKWNELFLLEKRFIENKYILVYFLDKPSDSAELYIERLKKELEIDVIGIPYDFSSKNISKYIDAGPIEFMNLVYNAEYVVTDSFHGTAFSLNFGTMFATFERSYGKSGNQSSRILSILNKVDLINTFEPSELLLKNFDFTQVEYILKEEREKSTNYLKNAFTEGHKQ